MKETIKLGMILLVITMISAGVLAVSNNLTKDKIAEIEAEARLVALKEIFGEDKEFKEIDSIKLDEIIDNNSAILEIFEVYNGDDLFAFAIKTKSSGYDGDIIMLTGFSLEDGNIIDMRILDHSETPGIGAKAEDPEFTSKFIGKNTDEVITVDTLTGATYTTNGVLLGINAAREVFNSQLSN